MKRLPIPAPGSDELLVKVAFVALNPADPAMIQFRLTPTGGVLGLDCAGEVVGVGSSVDGWKIGDRIAGVTPGGTGHRWGAATEYAIVDAALAWHVPDSIDLAAATTYGIAGATAALVLYHHLQVPEPPAQVPDAPWFLVAGGSSSVGLFLVQWAKLAGFRVVATASEHNFGLVKDYGAEEVLSYHEASHAIAAIRALQPPPAFGVDMIGGPCGDLVAEAVAEGKTLSINWQCHKDAELVRMGAAFAPVSLSWIRVQAHPRKKTQLSGIPPCPPFATGQKSFSRVCRASSYGMKFGPAPSRFARAYTSFRRGSKSFTRASLRPSLCMRSCISDAPRSVGEGEELSRAREAPRHRFIDFRTAKLFSCAGHRSKSLHKEPRLWYVKLWLL